MHTWITIKSGRKAKGKKRLLRTHTHKYNQKITIRLIYETFERAANSQPKLYFNSKIIAFRFGHQPQYQHQKENVIVLLMEIIRFGRFLLGVCVLVLTRERLFWLEY